MARSPIRPMPAATDAAKVLGQQVREARHQRAWTVAEFAKRLTVSPVTVHAIESGAPGDAIRADKLVIPDRFATHLSLIAKRRKTIGRASANDLFELVGAHPEG